ncbi:unnamed protein product [Arabidopsis halleri]
MVGRGHLRYVLSKDLLKYAFLVGLVMISFCRVFRFGMFL